MLFFVNQGVEKKIVEEKLGFRRGCVPVSVRIIDLLVDPWGTS